MSDYTPTTDVVRVMWIKGSNAFDDPTLGEETTGPEFDRWLADHDREVAATEREKVASYVETLDDAALRDGKGWARRIRQFRVADQNGGE